MTAAGDATATERGTIEVVAHASLLLSLALFARWRRLSVDIDGSVGRMRWGTRAFAVTPGEHVVTVGVGEWSRLMKQ